MTFKLKDGLQQDDRIVIDSETNVTAKSFFIGTDTVQDPDYVKYVRLKNHVSPFSSFTAPFTFTRTGSLTAISSSRIYAAASNNVGLVQSDRLAATPRGEPIEEADTNYILQSNTIYNNAWQGYKLTSTFVVGSVHLFATSAYNLFVPSAIGLSQADFTAFDEVSYTTPGTYSWVVPTGITSVSVVAVGAGGGGRTATSLAGGGGGGDLRYSNSLAVTPGETLTIIVGAGGVPGATPTAGGNTSIARGGTTLLLAVGGPAGTNGVAGTRGVSTAISGNIGGGTGGQSGTASGTTIAFGGGGAGGYSAAGGTSPATTNTAGNAGSGGGGASGSSGGSGSIAGGGGGVGLLGTGPNGVGGSASTTLGYQGGGGSYSISGTDVTGLNGTTAFQAITGNAAYAVTYGFGQNGGQFGGGGGGADSSTTANGGTGGGGAVRIIWNKTGGLTRTFPSTNTMNDGRHYAYTTVPITITSGTRYSFSFYAKANGYDFVRGYIPASGVFSEDQTAYFNLSTGTVVSSSGATGYIQKFYDGWYRCIVSTTAATATGSVLPRIYVGLNSSDDHFIGAGGTTGVYILQAQLEDVRFPSSPIITTTAAATRGASVASLNSAFVTANPSVFNYSEFTIGIQGYVSEFDSINNGRSPRILHIRNADGTSRIDIARGVGTGTDLNNLNASFFVNDVGVPYAGPTYGTPVANGGRFSAALSYSASTKKMYVVYNGDASTLQTFDLASYTLPTLVTTHFGSFAGVSGFWNGELGQIFSIGRAVSPSQLVYLSQQLYNEDN